LTAVIREKVQNPVHHSHFHYKPYELLWQPAFDLQPICLYGELYTSPTFFDAHQEVQEVVGEPGCSVPRVVVALMFWSDETHLTSFGTAKLWPLYLIFGNESKYRRSQSSSNVCEHVAYFELVSIHHFQHQHGGQGLMHKHLASRLIQRFC
jgi:Plavaka transposase